MVVIRLYLCLKCIYALFGFVIELLVRCVVKCCQVMTREKEKRKDVLWCTIKIQKYYLEYVILIC
jgi:hypothetical protein